MKVVEASDSSTESVDESPPDLREPERCAFPSKRSARFNQAFRAVRAGATPGSFGRAEGPEPGVAPARTAVPGPAARRHLGEVNLSRVVTLPRAGRGNQARNTARNIHSVGWLLGIGSDLVILIARSRQEEIVVVIETVRRKGATCREVRGRPVQRHVSTRSLPVFSPTFEQVTVTVV